MMQQNITYENIDALTDTLVLQISDSKSKFSSIYGVPRGGIPVAAILSQKLKLPLVGAPIESTLVVDDLADSGRTLKKYDGLATAVLFKKEHTKLNPTFCVGVVDKWVVFPWEEYEMPAEDAVIRVIEAIGEDPTREGLLETPKRVVKSWKEIFGGYGKDPKSVLKTTFEGDGYDEIVLLSNIEFFSTCEHHMLPFFGKAHVAYIPNERVVGLSKLARLVEVYSRRLQIQERLTNEISNAMVECLQPKAAAVILEAKHFCMVARGVGKQNSIMTTSSMRGLFKEDEKSRSELLRLIGV